MEPPAECGKSRGSTSSACVLSHILQTQAWAPGTWSFRAVDLRCPAVWEDTAAEPTQDGCAEDTLGGAGIPVVL